MPKEPITQPIIPPVMEPEKRGLPVLGKVYIGFLVVWFVSKILSNIPVFDSLREFAFWGTFILTTYYFAVFLKKIMRKLLWRIRRKLILSYIFIGFIPI